MQEDVNHSFYHAKSVNLITAKIRHANYFSNGVKTAPRYRARPLAVTVRCTAPPPRSQAVLFLVTRLTTHRQNENILQRMILRRDGL